VNQVKIRCRLLTEKIKPTSAEACLIAFLVIFGSPKSVVEYLGRYTHKIAISNNRIKSIDAQNVTFDYKDYRVAGVK
jgi:hypothetical protein